MMNFTCSYDRIKIYAPFLPMGHALSDMKFRTRSDSELAYIKTKHYAKVVYRYIVKGDCCTLMYEPCLKEGYIKQASVSVLSIKADGMTPAEIADIAFGVFGTLDKLTIAYIESRIDLFDIDFDTVAKSLLVQGKKWINTKYQGETLYYGRASSGHQVALYDKGLQLEGTRGKRIRVEARNRFMAGNQPLLTDFLSGKWRQETPFRKAFLVNSNEIPFTKGERISSSKKGLTPFMMSLKGKRKSTLSKHALNNIILDLNSTFEEWENNWLLSVDNLSIILHELTIPFLKDNNGEISFISKTNQNYSVYWGNDG